MKEIRIGNTVEQCVERSDYPPDRVREILKNETVAVLGYGVQGRGQSLNMRDNGVKVIVGQRKGGKAYDLCLEDGWKPGETLFDPEEAAAKGTVVQYLLSDAGQKEMWPKIKPHLTKGKALYFSHGFAIVFADQTGVIPPKDIDVILVAPKGSGTTVRRLFLEGRGINSSFAIHQDATGRARERCLALGVAIGSGYLFETTFKKEVVSDLTGERGALDWFKAFRDASKPVFEKLYQSVASGEEARRTLEANSRADYRVQLEKELKEVADSEMWLAGAQVRALRPERQGS